MATLPKKAFLSFVFLFFLAGFSLPAQSSAATGGDYWGCTTIDEKGNCDTAAFRHRICYEGLVPCGKQVWIDAKWDKRCVGDNKTPVLTTEILHCQLCHFFVMASNIVNYIFINIIPIGTILMLIFGGVMFYFGGARPELIGRAKNLFKGVVIGLVLVYGAFMVVGIFLAVLGAADIEPIKDVFKDDKIFSLKCFVEIPTDILPTQSK